MQITETQRINYILDACAKSGMNTEQILELELREFECSPKREMMLTGARYYNNFMDIMKKKRRFAYRKNNRLQHGFIRKIVDQKTDYLLSKPFSINTENKGYLEALNAVFDKSFQNQLKRIGKEAINKGIAWIQVYFRDGKIAFKTIPSEEVVPLWEDNDHTILGGIIRFYDRTEYEGTTKSIIRHVEYWSCDGVQYYISRSGNLIPDVEKQSQSHMVINEKPFNWERIPFIPFKYNQDEMPIICGLKELVDDYNYQKSIMADLLSDIPNFLYVLKNYGGQDLQEFLKELKESNAIKVDDNGGVETLHADIDTNAFSTYHDIARKDIYEFGRGIDTQNEDLGNASGVALKFRYSDLDLDANSLDTEFSLSLDNLLWFVDRYFIVAGMGDYTAESVEFVFNRDMIINELESIQECQQSAGIISDKTILANHPWVTNVEKELEEVQKQKEEANPYANAFPAQDPNQPIGGDGNGEE